QNIQADQREILLRDAAVREYADKLRVLGLRLDEDVLDVYNRFSRDEAVEVIRARAPIIQSDRDRKLSALINDARYADARRKLLAFLRAQVLWNRYKMDPAWMFELMKKYGPLDWRLVQPQALYWSTYGIHISRSESLGDIDAANTDRIVLNSLKDLTFYGRLVYTENVEAPDWPILGFLSDPRFIEATNREHERLGMLTSKARHEKFEQNLFRAGHINYLVTAIQMLYAQHDYAEARKYLDYIREKYNPEGPEWQVDDLRQFVVERLNKEGRPIYQVAVSQITAAMTAGWMGYIRGQPNVYRDSMRYVQLVYDVYEKEAVKRLKLPPFQSLQTGYIAEFLTRPQLFGLWMPLTDRGKLYRALAADSMLRADMGADVQLRIYDFIAPPLRAQCRSLGLDFETMFPEPPGLSEYRKQRARALPGGEQSDRP
ncbi:MAG TPA: hypothetical protein PK082_08230, partial [Phycisphaerae bacterium]|nr:hypothetical protein [Phycisphaerae bacterium]